MNRVLIEDRLKAWREDDEQGYWEVIELIAPAEAALRKLRRQVKQLKQQLKEVK